MNYWKRYISFIIGTAVYKQPLYMKFNTGFTMQGNSSTRAYLYNPSDETIAVLKAKGGINPFIQIDAGFEDDHGICVSGEIYNTAVTQSGPDRIVEMAVSDSATNWSKLRVSRTWPANVLASAVIADLAGMFLLPIGAIDIGEDKTYPAGLSFNMKLKSAMQHMARETGSTFFIRGGRVCFQSEMSVGIKTGVVLSPATGLIEQPVRTHTGWKIKSLFNYRIGAGEYVSVESESFKGDCKVIKGRHSFSEESAFTEMEVELI